MHKTRILVHAHFFYPNIAPEITDCIRNFIEVCGEESVEIVATYPDIKPEFAALLPQLLPFKKVKIVEVPNRGYDVAPFVCEVLNKYPLDNYDYIVKLHTKRDVDGWTGFRRIHGSDWRRGLLRFCETPEKVRQSLAAFERYPKLGMIASSRFIDYNSCDFCLELKENSRTIMRNLGIKPSYLIAISGTIFMVRAALFKSFANHFTYDDFPNTTSSNAHAVFGLARHLELAFGESIPSQGYIVSEGLYPPRLAALGYHTFSFVMGMTRPISHSLRFLLGGKTFDVILNKSYTAVSRTLNALTRRSSGAPKKDCHPESKTKYPLNKD